MKEAAGKRGRGFNEVSHPAPQADVIQCEWPVRVSVGPELI